MLTKPLLAASALMTLAALTGCTGGQGNDGPRAASATIVATPAAAVTADGSAPAQLTVTVMTKKGKPLARQDVALEVSPAADCALTPYEGVSDRDGTVRATLCSSKTGTRTVTATVYPGTKRAFRVSTTVEFCPGAPAAIAMVSGDHQVATAGAALAEPLVVAVTDARGNVVPGAAIDFAFATGGGQVAPASVSTNADGRAEATATLGTRAGPNIVTAAVHGAPALPAVAFLAIGQPGAPATIEIASGNDQSARVAAALADPLAVTVRDANGNAVPQADVTFAVTAGGGTIAPDHAATDPVGGARTALTLGRTAESLSVRASLASGPSVTFAATAFAGEPHHVEIALKDDFGVAGTTLAPAATVRDRYQNPVAGALATFVMKRGAGAIDPAAATTDAGGAAAATLTLGPGANEIEVAAGPARATFTVAGVVGDPIAAADFTVPLKDGFADLVVTNARGKSVSFYAGDGRGTFLLEPFSLQGEQPVGVRPIDFDNDGVLDLAQISIDQSRARIFRNKTGAAGGDLMAFEAVDPSGVPVGKAPASLAMGHWNPADDRSPDLAVANFGDDTVTVLQGDGSGNFPKSTTVTVGKRPMSIGQGRFRRDDQMALPYLATANYGDGTVTVLLGDATGAFPRRQTIAVGTEPTSLATSSGGVQFVAVACSGDRTIAILFAADGSRSFALDHTIQLGAGSTPIAVVAGELTGDLTPDLAVATAEGKVLVFQGSTSDAGRPVFTEQIGGFDEYAPPLGTSRPLGIAIDDLDPVGIFGRALRGNDMAVAQIASDEPVILLNQQMPESDPTAVKASYVAAASDVANVSAGR